MKMLGSLLFALMMGLTFSPFSVATAAEGRGHDMRQGGVHAAEGRDRGDQRRAERPQRVERGKMDQRRGNEQIRENRSFRQPGGERANRPSHPEIRRDVRRVNERNRPRGYVLDQRYHHNHYYPPRGHYVQRLPRGYREYHHHGERYYFYDGAWYHHSHAGFVVIAPPFGLVVPVLPLYYTTIWVGGVPYYYAGGVYYVWRPAMQGYVVTELPAESSVVSQPQDSDQFYVYPKEGQSEDQQAQDRYECHRWAVGQTGFDPSRSPGNLSESQLESRRSEYRRAIGACLDGRGYSVK